jgi:hypothetical protein
MTARETVAAIRQRGVTLSVKDVRLLSHPKGAIPPELAASAAEHRPEIIALLEEQARAVEDTPTGEPNESDQSAIDRIGQLDRRRNERDRKVGCGYDYAPAREQEEAQITRRAAVDRWHTQPATLAHTCPTCRELVRQGKPVCWFCLKTFPDPDNPSYIRCGALPEDFTGKSRERFEAKHPSGTGCRAHKPSAEDSPL